MFSGLSAFPLTPFKDEHVDIAAFRVLVDRLVAGGVDSLGILGSTGSYAYLDKAERKAILREAVDCSGGVPVIAGVGALRTRDVLELALDAEQAGAAGLLLAPVSYQPLHDDEVFSMYEAVCSAVSTPICVYDNPGTTHFKFSDALHGRIATLPNIASIKIPGVPATQAEADARVASLRAKVPPHVTIGISGDSVAARSLNAGCEVWYSVIGGLFPEVALQITRMSLAGRAQDAQEYSDRLQPLWALFDKHGGSIRVVATAAALLGLCSDANLPRPLQTLAGNDRAELASVLASTGLA
ncbi:dihydrodipicolinate synthase family protein [Stenotrophomonas sp.]|uniref:dihydrodipicolinate synthase family protein n=1 Tax=Stenotrophomonas sp. TaxID=69392 RepID=UPI0028AD589C|nr:dihydrodipicolinate synthase family protein [Stenotrophomonas sp.]